MISSHLLVILLLKEGVLILLTDQMKGPKGIGLSTDESKLYVAHSGEGVNAIWMEYRFREDSSQDKGNIFPGFPDDPVSYKDGYSILN